MTEHRLRKQWQEEDEAHINSAFDALLKVPNGRKALWWLLRIGKVGTQPYSNNALQTAFACGELNVGQQILDRITSLSPEGYVDMMKEMADERGRRDGQIVAARAERSEPGLEPEPGSESE